MPKLGRRIEVAELEYQWRENMTTSFAPFGTFDTPQMRTKIVGGKPVMVAEDRKRTTIPADEPLQHQLSPRKSIGNGGASPRLAPMTEKPNYFDPTPFVAAKNARNSQVGFMNSQPDSASQPASSSTLNPHPVVPPIGPGSFEANGDLPPPISSYRSQIGQIAPAPNDISDLLNHLPKDNFLPSEPVTYSKKEELELRRRVHQDMKGTDPKKFKEIYVELAGYDRQLSGLVNIADLGYTFSKYQVNLSALHLRLLAAMFVSPTQSGKLNYEKLLTFLAASHRDPSTLPAGGPTMDPNAHLGPEELKAQGIHYNVITHQHEDFSPRSNKFPFNDRENAKLLRYLETQLSQSPDPLDIEKCWSAFSMADRGKRGTLSKEQIEQLCYTLGIPIQGSLINAILLRCDENNEQYKWEQFLDFLGRVAPKKTGLNIPDSKKPMEYAKHYPVPGSNWPNGEWDNNDYGVPVSQIRKQPASRRSEPNSSHHPHIEPGRRSEPAGYERPHTSISLTTDGSASEMNESLQEILMEESPPVNPNDMLPTWNPRGDSLNELESRVQRQSEADRRTRNMDRLEEQYDMMNQGQNRNSHPQQAREPWFDRFMKLANAVYAHDAHNTGKVNGEEMRWLIEEYNTSYGLGFDNRVIAKVLHDNSNAQDNSVHVDRLLKDLGLHGK